MKRRNAYGKKKRYKGLYVLKVNVSFLSPIPVYLDLYMLLLFSFFRNFLFIDRADIFYSINDIMPSYYSASYFSH